MIGMPQGFARRSTDSRSAVHGRYEEGTSIDPEFIAKFTSVAAAE